MKNWTEKDEDVLRKYYENNTNKELALYLDRTPYAIGAKGRKMGLRKSKEAIRFYTKRTQFKKGHKPWHKGRKGQGLELGGKETRFKKGHTPVTVRPVGSTRTTCYPNGKCYKFVKVDSGEWIRVHRLIWEQQNGAIQKGYCIRMKDGDTLNTNIENLECVRRGKQ